VSLLEKCCGGVRGLAVLLLLELRCELRARLLETASHKLNLLCLSRSQPPIHERSEEELKKPTPSAYRRSSIIPACDKDTPPMVRPRHLSVPFHFGASRAKQKQQLLLPTVPVLLPVPSPRRLTLHADVFPLPAGSALCARSDRRRA